MEYSKSIKVEITNSTEICAELYPVQFPEFSVLVNPLSARQKSILTC